MNDLSICENCAFTVCQHVLSAEFLFRYSTESSGKDVPSGATVYNATETLQSVLMVAIKLAEV